MLKLYCITLGEGEVFIVEIEKNKIIYYLQKKIKELNGYKCHAKNLKLYVAKAKTNSEWIQNQYIKTEQIIDNKEFEKDYEAMDETFAVEDYFNAENKPKQGNIHILVKLPDHATSSNNDSYSSENELTEEQIKLYSHLEREASENPLKPSKDSNVNITEEVMTPSSIFYASIVQYYYSKYVESWKIDIKDIGPTARNHLHTMLITYKKAFGSLNMGKISEMNRLHYIVPVIANVCSLFNGEVEILFEETINGNEIQGKGIFDFVLVRGTIRLCIVQMKKYDINRATAQLLVGCEIISEFEDVEEVYGIITNYDSWYFYSVLPSGIKDTHFTLIPEIGSSFESPIGQISGAIYWMLSDKR